MQEMNPKEEGDDTIRRFDRKEDEKGMVQVPLYGGLKLTVRVPGLSIRTV